MIFIIPSLIYVSIRWILWLEIIVLEGLGVMEGLKRSWHLTKDHFWRIVALSFVPFLLAGTIILLPKNLLIYGYIHFVLLRAIPPHISILSDCIIGLLTIIIYPFCIAIFVLLYYDLRVSKGFAISIVNEQQETDITAPTENTLSTGHRRVRANRVRYNPPHERNPRLRRTTPPARSRAARSLRAIRRG